MPVNASTSVDLPWSICPAVPTMMLFNGNLSCCELLRAGDFFHDLLHCRARVCRGKYRAAHHQKISAGFDRFPWGGGSRLIVFLSGAILVFRPHARSDN